LVTSQSLRRVAIHPVNAVLLASTVPLSLGALLSDWAYFVSYEIQWSNFASWLIVGALPFAGLALLWAMIDFLRADVPSNRQVLIYLVVLAAAFLLGLLNALVHAKDAWATMPDGLILSVLVFILALTATWLGCSTLRSGDVR
jgi:uncharacterized membrane protein